MSTLRSKLTKLYDQCASLQAILCLCILPFLVAHRYVDSSLTARGNPPFSTGLGCSIHVAVFSFIVSGKPPMPILHRLVFLDFFATYVAVCKFIDNIVADSGVE